MTWVIFVLMMVIGIATGDWKLVFLFGIFAQLYRLG